jgi:hypothetical protein
MLNVYAGGLASAGFLFFFNAVIKYIWGFLYSLHGFMDIKIEYVVLKKLWI